MNISFRKYVVFIIIPVIAVAALLYIVTSKNIDQYFADETRMAIYSLNATESLIQQHLNGLRKNVGHFVDRYQDKIKNLASHTKDPALYDEIDKLVSQYFPDAVTFTIADHDGYVMLEDRESLIGKGCRENIRLFAINNEQSNAQLRIHSDSRNYHFDIMQEMHSRDGRVFIFYISFEPVIIADYISKLHLPGHEMMIIKKDSDSLIEITQLGARVKIDRSTHLDNEELDRVLATTDIDNTLWQLVDILGEDEMHNSLYIVIRDFGIIFVSFVLGIVLAFVIIMKHEKRRLQAEQQLNNL